MLICLCYGISCREIKKLLECGIKTTQELQKKCPAGTGCGLCLDALKKMVRGEEHQKRSKNFHEAVEQDNVPIQDLE
jgi:bacterioferritin-associated ferredoxin